MFVLIVKRKQVSANERGTEDLWNLIRLKLLTYRRLSDELLNIRLIVVMRTTDFIDS